MCLTRRKRKGKCLIHQTVQGHARHQTEKKTDKTKSTGVFGGAGLAHGPVLAASAKHPLSFSSAPAGNCQGRCWCDVGEAPAGFLQRWCCALCLQQILPHGLFLALPNTENWSKKLHRIYLGKDRGHWRVWRCTWKFLENHLFHQDTSQRSELLGFDCTKAGQCLCWEIGEGGITVMKARSEDLNKCLCNLKRKQMNTTWVYSWDMREHKLKLGIGLMPQVTVLAQEGARRKCELPHP